MSGAVYCVLCGVPILPSSEDAWTKEFRAIYTQNNCGFETTLSGVGQRNGRGGRALEIAVPLDSTKRFDDANMSPNSTAKIRLHDTLYRNMVQPSLIIDPELSWGFGFHSSCWTLLVEVSQPNIQHLFLLCLSMPFNLDGRILDWGHDYNGAIDSSRKHGVQILAGRFYNAPANDPIRFDPLDIPEIHQLRKITTLTLNEAETRGKTLPRSKGAISDPFLSLQSEILVGLAIKLQSKDVCSLRIASRAFANLELTEYFWASRFQIGFEYDYVFEVRQARPKSWKAMYASMALLQTNRNLLSRKRIWDLALRLHAALNQIDQDCHGNGFQSFLEPLEKADFHEWNIASRGLVGPGSRSATGPRALRVRSLQISPAFDCIFVSFFKMDNNSFVSGLRFRNATASKNGDSCIGYIHPDYELPLFLPSDLQVCGWHLAFHETGITAIAAVLEDGSTSTWVGKYDGIPKRRLATKPGTIPTIRADFDAIKMVSFGLSRSCNPPDEDLTLRDTCLWLPEVPQENLIFNGSHDNFPFMEFQDRPSPISTIMFRDETGQGLGKFLGIIGWVNDDPNVFGLQCLFTDPSKNKSLGCTGRCTDGQNIKAQIYQIPFPINGPGGETMSRIEVKKDKFRIYALKFITSSGRETTMPSGVNIATSREWTVIEPLGHAIVGLYSVLQPELENIGLISTNST